LPNSLPRSSGGILRPDLFTRLISFDEALRRTLAAAVPIERVEREPIVRARDRVAAVNVVSGVDVPAFDRAAMDGYAVRADDVADAAHAGVHLHCVGQIFAGRPFGGVVGPGECVEIGTGAPMPRGADTVVMVEQTSRNGDAVGITAPATPGQHVGRRGSDLIAGTVFIRRGDHLTPGRIGALAAAGVTDVEVFARPIVGVISTGDELTAPGEALAAGHVFDVNRFTLQAIIDAHGGQPIVLGSVNDSSDAIGTTLARANGCDVIVCSAGSSVGSKDLVTDAIERLGQVTFHGIAIKPGKPTLLGAIGATPVFGMPGNPASCLSNAYLLLVPFLRKMARLPAWQPTRRLLPLARTIRSLSERHQYFTVRIVDGCVEPAFKSSGDITSMAAADGFIEIPPGSAAIDAGTIVTVTLF
jgi:molybdenum cofactor synthesis domain-containing protein